MTPKNGCVFAPAGADCREVSSAQTGETVFISYDPGKMLSQAQSVSNGSLRELCFASDLIDPAIGALAQEMRRYFLSGRVEGEAYMEHLVSCIELRLIASMTGRSMSVGRENERISKHEFDAARAAIEDRLEGPISVTDLALYSGMATTRFAKAFRNTAGISVYQYILDRRIARATNLLVSQSDSLADIAYACGFSSQAHMTTVFGKKLGVTPGQYRPDSTG
ncbi:AraC family transcriptional regulator [Ruegeria sp. SCPT10]|uniref:helix-turn-helix transcriptional regulator n=1 Tax=Ruegeria sp. SCP10 TaxID=3141377 RepID=UPI003334F114